MWLKYKQNNRLTVWTALADFKKTFLSRFSVSTITILNATIMERIRQAIAISYS